MSDPALSRNLRFATFEVDLRNGELRKHGIRIKLQDQPFQVLAMLLAANGGIVTREELRAKLWAADTFVDFDTGLNTAVKRLRDALGDSAESPRYVETLPRKGYRFIYPVDNAHGAVESSAIRMAVPSPKLRPVWRRYVKIVAPVLLLIVLSVVLAGFRYLRPRPAMTDRDVIVLADFDNRTGEPVFDKTLKEALTVGLEQSPFLNVMPSTQIDQVLKQMTRSPGDPITAVIGREICLRTSSKALFTGSIATLGTSYALQIKAADCQTGNTLAAVSSEAESRERVLFTLGQAAASLRSKLGESLASVQKYDKPLEEATTSSLEALQAYTEGDRVYRLRGAVDAIPFFKRAVELDPKFGSAYTYLGAIYTNVRDRSSVRENLSKGFELRDRLSAKEQYMAAGLYYAVVTGEIERARQQFQVVAQEYPRDYYSRINLTVDDAELGQNELAATEAREAVHLQPDNFLGYTNLGACLIIVDRLDEAQAVLDEALTRKLDSPFRHTELYEIAFLRNDAAAMQRELNWALGKTGAEGDALGRESDTQAFYGRLTKARELSRAAEAAEKRDGAKEPAAFLHALSGFREAQFGNAALARQKAREALRLAQTPGVLFMAAATLIDAGDSGGAQPLLEALNKDRPLATLMQRNGLPALRAQVELSQGHAQRALELLESAKPYDLAADLAISMYSVHLRGKTYLALGNGTGAATEFQKILDHRGLVGNDVTGALAHLCLGRARAREARSLQGPAAEDAKAKARAAYRNFLTLWKDADADIPILRQAKAEYAKLTSPDASRHP